MQVNLCQAQHEPNSGINLPKGASTIKGTQALAFVRQRYGLNNGDLDRIHRQQYFLSAAFRKVSSAGVLLNPFKLRNLLKAVNTSLQMDDSLDPLKLAEQFQNLSAGNLIFKTIPTHGTADNDAGNVVVVDAAEVRQFATQLVGGQGHRVRQREDRCARVVHRRRAERLEHRRRGIAQRRLAAPAGVQGRQRRHRGDRSGDSDPVSGRHAGTGQDARRADSRRPAEQTSSVQRVTLVLGADGLQVTERGTASTPPAQHPKPTSSNGMTAADTGACVN